MVLFQFAMIIVSIAIILAISVKLFWVASFIIIYRTLSSAISFEYISDKFGIDHHIYYFLFMMILTIALHHLILLITANIIVLRYAIYIGMIVWVFYYFEIKEIFLLSDWFEASDIEFTFEYFKNLFMELVTTPPGDYIQYIIDFINGISDAITRFFQGIFNRG